MHYLDPQLAGLFIGDRQGRLRDEARRYRLSRPARRRRRGRRIADHPSG